MSETARPRVAFVLADFLDDWLESLGQDRESFANSWVGGWIFSYTSALAAAGVDSVLIATARVPSAVRRIHAPSGVPIWLLPPARAGTLFGGLVAKTPMPARIRVRLGPLVDDLLATPIAAIEAVIREERCAAILVQDYEATRFDQCIRMGRRVGIPVFATFTGTNPQPEWQKPFRRSAMRLAAGFVICAQSEIDRVRAAYGVPDSRLLKLYYPLDPAVWYPEDREAARRTLGLDPAPTIAVFHGMIHIRVKGLDILLDAWEKAVGPAPGLHFKLVLLGNGPDSGRLKEVIRTKGRDDVLFVNEWLHDRSLIRRYLSAADLYVFPTRVDAFGISVTEGMACGLPVVAARGRGTLDIFPDGERSGGVVVPSGDVDAFAEGLRRMLHNPSFRARLGANSLRRVKDPDLGPAVGETLAGFFFPDMRR